MNRTFFIMRAFALAALPAFAALTQFSCDENPSDSSSNLRILAYSGNNQTERVGAMLPELIVVKVTDLLNNAQPGVAIEFSTRAEPSAVVTPQIATTDAQGLASCRFQLGNRVGTQHVWATVPDDSTVLSATAVAVGCTEESPVKICPWPQGHIFITTTSSSLLSGAGSIIIDFDPDNGDITRVIETPDLIDGISFSSRGELFVSSPNKIQMLNTTYRLETYVTFNVPSCRIALEPNEGGVLTGLSYDAPQRIGCPGSEIQPLVSGNTFADILWENLAVDPVTRDIYMMTGSSPTNFVLWRMYWDGRTTSVQSYEAVANLSVGAAEPRGMCADSSGTIYISFDGNDNWRRIVSVSANGTVNYNFFNFYTYYGNNSQEAGRWGDIAYLAGKLFVIDRRNDRLVIVSKTGQWLAEIENTAFSRQLEENEHYAICASPARLCTMQK